MVLRTTRHLLTVAVVALTLTQTCAAVAANSRGEKAALAAKIKANRLIKRVADFSPTTLHANPGQAYARFRPATTSQFRKSFRIHEYIMRKMETYDLAAVIAGRKPAALIVYKDTALVRELLAQARAAGYTVRRFPGSKLAAVGKPENVALLASLYSNFKGLRQRSPEQQIEWDTAVGKALGYPDSAIESWVHRTGLKGKTSSSTQQ